MLTESKAKILTKGLVEGLKGAPVQLPLGPSVLGTSDIAEGIVRVSSATRLNVYIEEKSAEVFGFKGNYHVIKQLEAVTKVSWEIRPIYGSGSSLHNGQTNKHKVISFPNEDGKLMRFGMTPGILVKRADGSFKLTLELAQINPHVPFRTRRKALKSEENKPEIVMVEVPVPVASNENEINDQIRDCVSTLSDLLTRIDKGRRPKVIEALSALSDLID